MYKPLFSLPPPVRRGRFFCNLFLLLFALTATAVAKDTLAILPFTGGQGEDGETIAELFSFEKVRNTAAGPGVNLDSRADGRAGGWE